MSTQAARRAVHNEIAEWYDLHRPGYRDEVADDIAFLAGLPEGGRILEVGCGTGHGTALFASRGYDITAIEPGEGMARVARRRFEGLPNVRVVESLLEDWEPERAGFDLVLGASSLHLVAAEHRFTKPAALLKPGGAIAVVWHDRDPGGTALHRSVEEAYRLHAPSLETPTDLQGLPPEDHLDATGLYQGVFMRRYRWSRSYPTEGFLSFLDTYATHRLLPAGEHTALFGALGRLIDGGGGTIEQHFTTRLWVARKR